MCSLFFCSPSFMLKERNFSVCLIWKYKVKFPLPLDCVTVSKLFQSSQPYLCVLLATSLTLEISSTVLMCKPVPKFRSIKNSKILNVWLSPYMNLLLHIKSQNLKSKGLSWEQILPYFLWEWLEENGPKPSLNLSTQKKCFIHKALNLCSSLKKWQETDKKEECKHSVEGSNLIHNKNENLSSPWSLKTTSPRKKCECVVPIV